MDQASKVAFVQAQTVCALAEIEGMKAENAQRLKDGLAIAYGEAQFMAVPDRYQIGWNTVLSYLGDR